MNKPFALLTLGLALSAAPRSASADATWGQPAGLNLNDRHEHALVKQRSGRILTIMGLVHLAIGGALFVKMGVESSQCARTPTCMNEMGGLPEIVAGSLLVSSGAVFATSGIPMWVIGGREAATKQQGIDLNASGLRVRF